VTSDELRLPVLVLGFNRPERLRELLLSLPLNRISQVFVSLDGPRGNRSSDVTSCAMSLQVAQEFQRSHPITIRQAKENQGTAIAVPAGIDWFFEHVEYGIILEDDCKPSESFFDFAAELLPYYKEDQRILMVSGNNYHYDRLLDPNAYVFSRHGHIWGWATWRRAWKFYDHSMEGWPELRRSSWLDKVCSGNERAAQYWRWVFDQTVRDRVEAWDYRWTFAMWKVGGLSIVPPRNLVENTGFDESSTNTTECPDWYHRIPRGPIQLPLLHPTKVEADEIMDRWTDINIFETDLRGLRRAKQAMLRSLARVGLDRFALRLASLLRSVRK